MNTGVLLIWVRVNQSTKTPQHSGCSKGLKPKYQTISQTSNMCQRCKLCPFIQTLKSMDVTRVTHKLQHMHQTHNACRSLFRPCTHFFFFFWSFLISFFSPFCCIFPHLCGLRGAGVMKYSPMCGKIRVSEYTRHKLNFCTLNSRLPTDVSQLSPPMNIFLQGDRKINIRAVSGIALFL